MTKSDTIDAILRLNPSANPMFLAGFSVNQLDLYLKRLRTVSIRSREYERVLAAKRPRGADSSADTPCGCEINA